MTTTTPNIEALLDQLTIEEQVQLQSGSVVTQETSPNTEVLWNDRTPAGLTWGSFSARARFEYVSQADGLHQFSIISAGRSRMRMDGETVIDLWDDWKRGETYFMFGCDEVIHQRIPVRN